MLSGEVNLSAAKRRAPFAGVTMFRRRELKAASLLALLLGASFPIHAQAQDTRIAIIDSSDNTMLHVATLRDMGVLAIGRYYGRCPQWTGKRMIDNLDEINAILDDGRLGILSVYQFHSQDEKFDSDRPDVTSLDDRPRKPDPKTVEEFNDCVSPARPNTIEEDAKLDGYAAVTQAKEIIKQPPGTAIYFGVDFNLTSNVRQQNAVKYFRIINKMVKDAGYVMGVYGNGAISDMLYGEDPAGEKLVKYVWLAASSSHAGSANTYNVKHWDLLQKANVIWSVDHHDVSLDTNFQNPKSTDIGFWNKAGSFIVPHDRNVAVHDARRFVCEGSPVVVDDDGRPAAKPVCTATFGLLVRTFEMNASKTLAKVDCDEDGKVEGWMKVKDLSTKRPLWIDDQDEREKAHCTNR